MRKKELGKEEGVSKITERAGWILWTLRDVEQDKWEGGWSVSGVGE